MIDRVASETTGATEAQKSAFNNVRAIMESEGF